MTLAWSTKTRGRTADEAISLAKDEWQDFEEYCGWGPASNRFWQADQIGDEQWEVSAWTVT